MNTTHTPAEWYEIKNRMSARWSKLDDSNIESVIGNSDLVTGKLEQAYGYSQEQAEQEFREFNQSDEPSRASSRL